MSRVGDAERIAMRGLLDTVNQELGTPLSREWEQAFWAVPRHRFLPPRIWVGAELEPCDQGADPEAWLRHAYADESAVTQINDGRVPRDDEQRWASCSASAPSVVFRMLDMLDVEDGLKVLEIGAGTGWNAGLLAHRAGAENVTTVEVDPALSSRAASHLRNVGLEPTVLSGDGAAGVPDAAPYDRVIATCSVRRIPASWVRQTAPGGLILTPWETPWFCYGFLRLTVGEDGAASGRFAPHGAFMLMRGHRTDLRIYRDVVREEHVPAESSTAVSPWSVTGDAWAARFSIGLQLRDVWHAWHDNPDVPGVTSRLWLATTDAGSWAAVDWDGRTDERFTVWQHGPRRLWNEVETAHDRWRSAGEPGPGRYGMTVDTDGNHVAWLDDPDHPVAATV